MSDAKTDEFGRYVCDVPGVSGVWVQFKARGYPFGMRRKWQEARTDEASFAILLPKVEAWHLLDVDGKVVALQLPAPAPETEEGETKPAAHNPLAFLDNVDGAVVTWLVTMFTRFLLYHSSYPPKG